MAIITWWQRQRQSVSNIQFFNSNSSPKKCTHLKFSIEKWNYSVLLFERGHGSDIAHGFLLKAIVCCRSVHKQLLSDRKSQRWQWFRYIRCISLQKSHQESQKRDRMHEHSNSRAGFCSAWGVWLDQGVTQRWEQCRQISSQREKNSRKSFHGKHSISSLKTKVLRRLTGEHVNTLFR